MNEKEFKQKVDDLIAQLKIKGYDYMSKQNGKEEFENCDDSQEKVLQYLESHDDYLVKLLEWAPIVGLLSEEVNNFDRDHELVVKLRMIYQGMIREIGVRTLMILGVKND